MPRWVADHVSSVAAAALLAELETWPKPGLVSHVDSGSHADMDASMLKASATAIAPFYDQLAVAGAAGSGMNRLREIGVEAERAMLAATGGVNTHRGAIFGLGLICAAAGAVWSGTARAEFQWRASVLGATVRQRWGQAIMRGPIPLHSHGTNALRRFGAGGARAQAVAGWRLTIRRPLAYRAFSQFWRRSKTPICFTVAAPPACATPRKRLWTFSDKAVSNRRTGVRKPRQRTTIVLTAMYWGRWQTQLAQDPLGPKGPHLAKILKTHWVRTLLINAYAVILLVWAIKVLS
jgi:hypothetical protein